MSRDLSRPDARSRPSRPALLTASCGLVVLILAVWYPVLSADFLSFDDPIYVTENAHVLPGLTCDGVRWALAGGDERGTYWQPLTWLSHMVDVELWGLDPRGHHLGNVLLHAANSLLLLLGLACTTGRLWPSLTVAVLFAVHPLNAESVAWVAERKNLLSTLLMLATLAAYAHYARRPGVARYMVVVVALVCGLATKPMLVTVPILLLLLDLWPLGRLVVPEVGAWSPSRWSRLVPLVLDKLPLAAVTAAAAAMVLVSLRPAGNFVPAVAAPLGLRLANAAWSFVAYLDKILVPRNLSIFYRYPTSIAWWQLALAALVLVGMAVASLLTLRTRPWVAVGCGWFVVSLGPVLGVVQAGEWPAIADRWAYVPMIGVLVVVVWAGAELLDRFEPAARRATAVLGAGLLMLTLGSITHYRAQLWQSTRSLFEDALALDARNHVALMTLANVAVADGDEAAAVHYLERALEVSPHEPEALTNLGVLLSDSGDTARAARLLRRALALDPDDALAHNALGVALARLGDLSAARGHFEKALSLEPGLAVAAANLARVNADLEARGPRPPPPTP